MLNLLKMAGMSLLRSKLETFITSANEALEIRLVRSKDDIDNDDIKFHPEFTHQVFGDNENIFGFKDLKVQLCYTAGALTTYLGMKYSEKLDPKKFDGVEADDVLPKIAEKLQPGFLTNIDEFSAALSKDQNFTPLGTKLHEFTIKTDNNINKQYEIYQADISVPQFKDYHERLQTFVLWFIDAASFIDIDDENWRFFVMYERYMMDSKIAYAFIGYATVYHYYAYPNMIRPRISQLLILPPFQRKGLGAEMLQSVYNTYISDATVQDITVEDPSDDFVRLRDFVDARNCLKLSSFHHSKLHDGFVDEMVQEAQQQFKINKKQARRVYEILRLHATDMKNKEQYRKYRLAVKRRLNIPFQKHQTDLAKLQKMLKPEELKATLNCSTKEQRLEQLDRQYKDLELEYRHILERLAESDLS